ncbi:MAG: small subunit ribosomal protein S16 [Planctomycetota bacterium]|jgi:small subunit ribosomal protein S16
MAVVIRLKRTGRRNRPCYRISVADSRSPRDGRVLDSLGLYDPVAPKAENQSSVDIEKARQWLSQGALPSETVRSVFKRHGVFIDWSLPTPKRRKRTNRKASTATTNARKAVQKVRADRKAVRQSERSAAKKAAANAEASGSDE